MRDLCIEERITIARTTSFLVLGAGLAGATAALRLAQMGHAVTVIDRMPRPLMGASRHNEGKLHLGYVYAADQVGQTRRMMAEGSLQFLPMIEKLTGVPAAHQWCSGTFNYVVPDTSMKPVEALWRHVETVDAEAAIVAETYCLPVPPKSTRLTPSEVSALYSNRVQAAFRTPEIAVCPVRLSDTVAACLLEHPLIDFVGGAEVVGVDRNGPAQYRVTFFREGETVSISAPGVINALWEDRTRIDAMVGLRSELRWMQRWKATLTVDMPHDAVDLPATTGFVGPYGDVVIYARRRVYVSWYPALCLSASMTATPEETRALVQEFDQEKLRQQALAGLGALMPGVAVLDQFSERSRVGGGFIMAVGESDIEDPSSVLHQRHHIGIEASDGWVSVSTGKFCTAPQFGLAAAEALAERVAT